MNTRPGLRLCARWMPLAPAGAGARTVAYPAAAEAHAACERELPLCKSNRSSQGRATCLREADVAHAQAKRGGD